MRNYTQEYQYDEIGNLIQIACPELDSGKSNGVWTRDYQYNYDINTGDNNYLFNHDLNSTTADYLYDVHGNMTKMPHLQELKYDYGDQLNEVTLDASNNKAYYAYDANGDRVRKVVVKNNGTIVENRFYVGNYEIFSKTVNNVLDTERETLHIIDDKSKVALIDYDTINETTNIRYQLTNHLGSASLETYQNAAIISYEEYHPFGTTSYRSGSSEAEVSLKRYKYVFKELDNETGLYYYGMRYYAAWIVRFISVDPLQFKYPELTPFQYEENNSISYIDLDGAEAAKGVNLQRNTIRPVINNRFDFNLHHKNLVPAKKSLQNNTLIQINEFNDKNEIIDTKYNEITSGYMMLPHNMMWVSDTYPGGGQRIYTIEIPKPEISKYFPSITPTNELQIGVGSSSSPIYGFNKLKVHSDYSKATGYWEWSMIAYDHGFKLGPELDLELISASGGKIIFEKSYIESLNTNSLSKVLNNTKLISYGSIQGGLNIQRLPD